MSEDSDEPRNQNIVLSVGMRSRRSGIPSLLRC